MPQSGMSIGCTPHFRREKS